MKIKGTISSDLTNIIQDVLLNNIQEISAVDRLWLHNADASGTIIFKPYNLKSTCDEWKIILLNVLESSWHQLLDSGIKNRIVYFKKLFKKSIWFWSDLGDAT